MHHQHATFSNFTSDVLDIHGSSMNAASHMQLAIYKRNQFVDKYEDLLFFVKR